jgi:hypothetical protein
MLTATWFMPEHGKRNSIFDSRAPARKKSLQPVAVFSTAQLK